MADMASALIGLGANLGDRQRTLDTAVARLAALPDTRLLAQSRWLVTAPVGGPSGQGEFLNGAARLDTGLSAATLHAELHIIEAALGRHRGERWQARVLDLDLLLYDSLVLRTAELELPHPGLAYRRFVLEPAAEVAAEWQHPTIGWTIGQLLEHLNRAPNYVALAGHTAALRAGLAAKLAAATGARLVRLADCGPPPDWFVRLAPSADSTVQNSPCGIEFFRCLAGNLISAAPPGIRLWVSDFWWGEIPSWLQRLTPADQQGLLAAWEEATPQVPESKLIISLAGPLPAGCGPWLEVDPAAALDEALSEAVAATEAMR